MTDVRPVPEADLEAFRRLHNEYVDRDESLATVREWHDEHPDLLLGAYRDGELVGHALGRPWEADTVELAGIAVLPDLRGQGIGSDLLAAFEDRARAAGFRRVTLASAGGYVDEFYRDGGYEPESVLVRHEAGEAPRIPAGYDVVEETVADGVHKYYVAVDGFDPSFLETVREAFDDPGAIHVMGKELDG